MHHVGRLATTPQDNGPYTTGCEGLSRFPLVGQACGSPHQGLTAVELTPGGRIGRHVQAYEEALYVLDGELALDVAGTRETLVADDYCFVEKGVPHGLANDGSETVRWLELAAPQPGAEIVEDTVFLGNGTVESLPEPAYILGRFELGELPEPSSVIGLAGFGAANVGGAALKMLVDPAFGGSQFNLMVVQYAPGGFITEHDHAFEEAFFFVTGEIEAVLDGTTYTLEAGDYCWSGVGSRHSFANRGDVPVRWIETQVPQPPARHQARFKPDWERLVAEAAGV
jgi:quercetin dioxygenase-like cupin family protein